MDTKKYNYQFHQNLFTHDNIDPCDSNSTDNYSIQELKLSLKIFQTLYMITFSQRKC
jgi:hypothetical protein